MSIPKLPPVVAETFKTYPAAVRRKLMKLRHLIYDTAAATEGVGPLTETLKWSEPAYLTALSKSGSTIRVAWKRSAPDCYAMYFNCKTSLVDDFRTLFAEEFNFEGYRAIVFGLSDEVQKKPLAACIAMALTYHRKKS
jgi:hypothetical protein